MRKIGLRCRQNCCSVSAWWFAWYGGGPQPMSALAACVPSGGRERCVQTHGAHWGGGTQSDLARLPVLRSPGWETSSGRWFWTGRRRERRRSPVGRTRNTGVSVGSLGDFCPSRLPFVLLVLNADVSGPLSRDVVQPPPARPAPGSLRISCRFI